MFYNVPHVVYMLSLEYFVRKNRGYSDDNFRNKKQNKKQTETTVVGFWWFYIQITNVIFHNSFSCEVA